MSKSPSTYESLDKFVVARAFIFSGSEHFLSYLIVFCSDSSDFTMIKLSTYELFFWSASFFYFFFRVSEGSFPRTSFRSSFVSCTKIYYPDLSTVIMIVFLLLWLFVRSFVREFFVNISTEFLQMSYVFCFVVILSYMISVSIHSRKRK